MRCCFLRRNIKFKQLRRYDKARRVFFGSFLLRFSGSFVTMLCGTLHCLSWFNNLICRKTTAVLCEMLSLKIHHNTSQYVGTKQANIMPNVSNVARCINRVNTLKLLKSSYYVVCKRLGCCYLQLHQSNESGQRRSRRKL